MEIEESFTASPAQPEVQPAVLETPLELPSGPDQELTVALTRSPEVEMDPMLCLADVSNRPQSNPTESDGPNAEPEDEPTEECVNPSPPVTRNTHGKPITRPFTGPDCASSQNDTP